MNYEYNFINYNQLPGVFVALRLKNIFLPLAAGEK